VLSADANVPPVAQTAVGADLLKAFQIISQFGGNVLRKDLAVLARLEIFLTIQEPYGNFELTGILNDGHELFNFIGGEFTGPGVQVDFGFLANQVRKAATDSGDFREGKDDIALSFNVGIENTQNVLKFRSLHERRRPAVKEVRVTGKRV